MHHEIQTVPINDGDTDYALNVSSVSHEDITLSWRDIWAVIRGRQLHLRVICRRHPLGENESTAILRFR